MKRIELRFEAKITCPECGFTTPETMPDNACVHFYKCANCGKILKPKVGDCCVFCSYADTKCPSEQIKGIQPFEHGDIKWLN
jgi:hypothetical protein